MTRVDFYILDKEGATHTFICRLTEKAYQMGHRIYIHARDSAQVDQLDQLLWTFRDGSFLPHEPYTEGGTEGTNPPIQIGCNGDPNGHEDLLINLCDQPPTFFSRFHRVAEVIGPQQQEREIGRKRFRFYKERGYPLDTHNITA